MQLVCACGSHYQEMAGPHNGMRGWAFALALCLLGAFAHAAKASIGLVVGEPFGSFGTMMPVGHASIYLDHLCAESPTRLRPCAPGEAGVVLSRYHDLKETQMDWLAFPLGVFFYGSEDVSTVPLRMTRTGAADLRERYRMQNLEREVPARNDHEGRARRPKYGDWEEGIGAAFDRTLYVYEIDTTPAQDAALLAKINSLGERRRYTLRRANCADFAEALLSVVAPGAFHRKVFADFDMTTPKTLAWQLDEYGRRHPELHLRVYKVPQVPGTPPRSRPTRGAAESLIKIKRYLATLLLVQPEVPLACWVIYEEGGRWRLGKDAEVVAPSAWGAEGAAKTVAETTQASDAAATSFAPN